MMLQKWSLRGESEFSGRGFSYGKTFSGDFLEIPKWTFLRNWDSSGIFLGREWRLFWKPLVCNGLKIRSVFIELCVLSLLWGRYNHPLSLVYYIPWDPWRRGSARVCSALSISIRNIKNLTRTQTAINFVVQTDLWVLRHLSQWSKCSRISIC